MVSSSPVLLPGFRSAPPMSSNSIWDIGPIWTFTLQVQSTHSASPPRNTGIPSNHFPSNCLLPPLWCVPPCASLGAPAMMPCEAASRKARLRISLSCSVEIAIAPPRARTVHSNERSLTLTNAPLPCDDDLIADRQCLSQNVNGQVQCRRQGIW